MSLKKLAAGLLGLWSVLLIAPSLCLAETIGFDIVLIHENQLSQQVDAAFLEAESIWESLVVGYEDTLTSTTLVIQTQIDEIDGVGDILGSAFPSAGKFGREERYLYAAGGSMTFDQADLEAIAAIGLLDDLILHEMGHVIGIGSLWSSSSVGLPGFQELYEDGSGRYYGQHALAAYREEFDPRAQFVPIELDGGPGTANAHWNEEDLGDELMTGFISGETFISGVTLGGLRDLGYSVVPEPRTVCAWMSLVFVAAIGAFKRRRLACPSGAGGCV